MILIIHQYLVIFCSILLSFLQACHPLSMMDTVVHDTLNLRPLCVKIGLLILSGETLCVFPDKYKKFRKIGTNKNPDFFYNILFGIFLTCVTTEAAITKIKASIVLILTVTIQVRVNN